MVIRADSAPCEDRTCPVVPLPLARRDAAAADPALGTAKVSRLDTFHWGAWCSCGWNRQPVLLRSVAVVDALQHCAQQGCQPAQPLLDARRRPDLQP